MIRKWIIISLIALTFISFILFRVIIPFQYTFTDNGIQLNTVDAYYMVRYAEVYPNIPVIDYFFNYPDGISPMSQVVYPALISNVSDVLSIDIMTPAVIVPPILMLLILLMVFVICKLLFKEVIVALVAVFILSVMSGEIMYRTMLGGSDYHCLEIFLATAVIMYFIVAIKSFGDRWRFTFSVLCTALALFAYIQAWAGGVIGLFIIGSYLFILGCLEAKQWKMLVVSVVMSLLVIGYYFINTPMFMYYGNNFLKVIIPNITTLITEEMPLFFTSGSFDFVPMWNYFGITFYLALFGLGFLIQHYVKYRKPEILFLVVWTLIILAMTFAQRRFAYYLAINIAVITAYIMVLVLSKIKTRASVIKLSLGLFLIVVVPFARMDIVMADYGRMPIEWQKCTQWLKQQSNQSEYYDFDGIKLRNPFKLIEGSSSYRAYVKGEKTGYGALSWWDYGNWIIVSGRTPALCTPIDQDSGKASGIFTETDMSKAVNKLKELQLKYVIIDEDMFKDKLYPIIRSAKADGVTIKDMFMYRLFYLNDVKGVELVWNDSSLKVFEVKW